MCRTAYHVCTGDGRVLNRHKRNSLHSSNLVWNATIAFSSAFPSSQAGLSGPVLHHYTSGRFISVFDPLQLDMCQIDEYPCSHLVPSENYFRTAPHPHARIPPRRTIPRWHGESRGEIREHASDASCAGITISACKGYHVHGLRGPHQVLGILQQLGGLDVVTLGIVVTAASPVRKTAAGICEVPVADVSRRQPRAFRLRGGLHQR